MWCGILFGRIWRRLAILVHSQFVYFAKCVSFTHSKISPVIKSNKSLCRIAEKCLLSDPSKCPTVARLCDMLVCMCRAATLRELATFLAKSYIFHLCLTILVIFCWQSENAGSNAKCFMFTKRTCFLAFLKVFHNLLMCIEHCSSNILLLLYR